MTELKTLKDIEFGRNEKEDRIFLKEEAIQWIRSFEKDLPKLKEGPMFSNDEKMATFFAMEHFSIEERVKWIKHFFNITEEDVNGEEPKKATPKDQCECGYIPEDFEKSLYLDVALTVSYICPKCKKRVTYQNNPEWKDVNGRGEGDAIPSEERKNEI